MICLYPEQKAHLHQALHFKIFFYKISVHSVFKELNQILTNIWKYSDSFYFLYKNLYKKFQVGVVHPYLKNRQNKNERIENK